HGFLSFAVRLERAVSPPHIRRISRSSGRFSRKIADLADGGARCGMLAGMRSTRMRTSLFLALTTTLLAEFFLLIWRVKEQPALIVVAVVLGAVAIVL